MSFIKSLFFLLFSLVLAVPAAFSQSASAMNWKGAINKKIHFSMWTDIYDVNSGLVTGEIQYAKGRAPIFLIGSWKNDTVSLKEMLPDGTISGLFDGTANYQQIKGQWRSLGKIIEKNGRFSYKEGKSYPFDAANQGQGHEPYNWVLDPNKIAGTYRYSYGNLQDEGTLVVRKEKDGRLAFQINSTTSAPSFNMAQLPSSDGGESNWAYGRLNGNQLLYEVNQDCAITINFYNDFAQVQYVKDRYCRGYFGMGATVSGDFLKIKSSKKGR